MEKTDSVNAQSLSRTGLAHSLKTCSVYDEVIKMPIQVRITLRKSSCVKTSTTISHIKDSNIVKITPFTACNICPKDCGKGITLTVLNVPSLNNKAAIFTDFICEHQPDLLATWFRMENEHQKLSVPLVVIGFWIIHVLVVEVEVLGYFLKTVLRWLNHRWSTSII